MVEGPAEEKGLVGGWEERERRRWVVEEGFSRMILALGGGVSGLEEWRRGGGDALEGGSGVGGRRTALR